MVTEVINYAEASALDVWAPGGKGAWDTINVPDHPTFVILDIGCTRSMGSRPAVTNFVREEVKYGLKFEYLTSDAQFSFANSQRSTVKEKVRVHFPVEPPCWTEFDILEEGSVPILLSLGQMRNLRFTLEMEPDVVYLTCKAFHFQRVPLKVASTRHLVLDLTKLQERPMERYGNFLSIACPRRIRSGTLGAPRAEVSTGHMLTARGQRFKQVIRILRSWQLKIRQYRNLRQRLRSNLLVGQLNQLSLRLNASLSLLLRRSR